ncbi:MAG: endopeptidase La [Gemmatimonadetes bacterium]|nr:MAG: endopeptidase La [Gemmatimonadota bacterium]
MAKLIRVDQTLEIPDKLPVIALRDLVFFPYMVLPLLIGRPRSLRALDEAAEDEGFVLLLAQREAHVEEPERDDLFRVGTVARVLQSTPLPDGNTRVVLEGVGRARVRRFLPSDGHFRASVEPFVTEERHPPARTTDPEEEALVRGVERLYLEYIRLNDRLPSELSESLSADGDRARLAHLMAGHLLVLVPEKQELLETDSVPRQFEALKEILVRELEILRIEEKLDEQIRSQMDQDRRQFYLQEQLKAIHRELGSGADDDWTELEGVIRDARLPAQARERAERELGRLRKLNPVAPEAAVIRTYLEWILALPWEHRTEDNLDVQHAARVLDEAHFGLDEVKERVLDHIAVLSLVGELKGPILCLVGPPGVGKTSLGRSIARALGREFVRVSLGGVRDEAEIRGHRRTYVGALPGRILQGMRRAGSSNPVFLLDEVDKLASDFHGDPGAALLEVLDPEQNRSFTDHYLELDYDLSHVLWVATANTLAGIPGPLRDRMEVIRLPGYLETEKRTIAMRFLWPRQVSRHGLTPERVSLAEEAVNEIIRSYTREAGVRELERRVSRVARKLARRVAEGELADDRHVAVGADDLPDLLGPPPYLPPDREEGEHAGIANGLAWTEAGGEVLDVEVAAVRGTGKIQLTGTLGEVMKESAFAAVTYARARAASLGLDPDFHRKVDLHIHIPEGATPKDGPSAGITIATAIISALTDIPTRPEVAMTGEITLRGRVLAVGGIKEKAVAAMRAGIRRVILPAATVPELERLPAEVRETLEFVPVRTMDEVLAEALTRPPEARPAAAATLAEPRDAGLGVHRTQ